MVNLNCRQKDLLRALLNEMSYKTMGQYSQIMNVSERTLYNDLKEISEVIKQYKITIEKKPRIGIRLNGDIKDKNYVLNTINNSNQKNIEFTTKERQLKILKMLLVEEEIISYQKLSDIFLVSKTSIYKDMEFIQSLFGKKAVCIESSKKGTRISGTEIQIQYSLKKYTELLLKEKNVLNEKDFFKYSKGILKEIYPSEIVEIVFDEIIDFEKDLEVSLSYYYIKSLIITLIIYIFRLTKDKHIDLVDKESLKDNFISRDIIDNISKKMKIEINENDINYLNKQLLAHCMNPQDRKKEHEENDEQYKEIVSEIIDKMGEIMKIDFSWDVKLYNSLMLHIVPMIYRLKMDIKIHNPILSEIKSKYSVVLNATWYVMSKISKDLGIVINEDEVSFITMHIQTSIERNQDIKKILIVCPTGISSSELIANKIKKFLPAKDIIKVTSIRDIYKQDLTNVDLIISSVDLDIINKPVVHVSALLSNEDLKNIYKCYANIAFTNNEVCETTNYNIKYIKKVIDEDMIFTNQKFDTKEDALSFLIDQFENKNLVKKGFRESVLNRENSGSTSLESLVAIPHAMPSTVKQSKFGILTLDKPIMWSNKLVHTVILISFAEKDLGEMKNILSELYDIVRSKDIVNNLFKNRKKEEILEVLGGHFND